jgi:hypothetical protein
MVHCGYEPAAVEATFGSWRGLWRTARLAIFGPPKPRTQAEQPLAPLPVPSLRRGPNGLPSLPILDRA